MSLLLLNLAMALLMTGVIWFVQIVHYPLFEAVGEDRFVAYEATHSRTTTYVVAPLMVIELISSTYLFFDPPSGVSRVAMGVAFALTVLVWLATALISVPQHNLLAVAFDRDAWRKLVVTNWVRTAGWTARSLLLLFVVWGLLDR